MESRIRLKTRTYGSGTGICGVPSFIRVQLQTELLRKLVFKPCEFER